MAKYNRWSRDELLCVLRLYCRTPYGRLHQHNPAIIKLSGLIGRTPSAVAMQACNFGSLDPTQRARGVSGLKNSGHAGRELFAEFLRNAEAIASEAEEMYLKFSASGENGTENELTLPDGPTEVSRTVRTRRVQSFFRDAVKVSYKGTCAISGIAVPELLIASHIIPWSVDVGKRADPRNGILLNSLYDKAFDRGLITFDSDLRVVVSVQLRISDPPLFQKQALIDIEGAPLRQPTRFAPDPDAMAYHREHVFQSA
jgi:HNH endonuclease